MILIMVNLFLIIRFFYFFNLSFLCFFFTQKLVKKEWSVLETTGGPKGIEMHSCHIYESEIDFKKRS
jgi:hypothetical protein